MQPHQPGKNQAPSSLGPLDRPIDLKHVRRLDEVPGHVFTHSYAQPADYRFCQDSVIFPWLVAQTLNKSIDPFEFRALDIGAGCGVIGFELVTYLPEIRRFDFIEIQNAFASVFAQNLKIIDRDPENFCFINENYDCLMRPEYAGRYDLIVSNPPYFFVGDGKPAQVELRNRCRFFVDSSLDHLLSGIALALKADGQAFLLVKPGGPHGRSVLNDVRCAADKKGLTFSLRANIRGTAAVSLKK